MEHTWVKYVRPVLTPFWFGSVLTLGRTGESRLADHEVIDPPVREASDEAVPQSDLLKEVLSLAEEADRTKVTVSLGSLPRAERRRRMYGA